MPILHPRRRRTAAAFTLLLALAGCSITPERPALDAPLPARFSDSGATPWPERWWQPFADPELEALIGRALDASLTLRGAWARLRQVEATARVAGAARRPTLDASARVGGQSVGGGDWSDSRQAGLAAAYEVDLWGRLGALDRAAELDAAATAADLQTAAVTLSAEVAGTWYQLVEQRAQLALIDSQLGTNRDLLGLIETRLRSGLADASDLYRQRQLVEQTRSERIRTATQLALLQNRLAVLLGAAPGMAAFPPQSHLPALPPLPATGLPASLIQRRPDLRSALAQLRAADARAAAAVSARYPRLNLTAALTSTDSAGELFSHWLGELAAQLALPLFDGGQRRAEADRTRAVVAERLHAYGQAVLEAVREVEDALAGDVGQGRLLASLDAQLKEAEATVARERKRYLQGDSDYLSVLDALRSRQSLERQIVTARREQLAQRIGLARALAGGWTVDAPDVAAGDAQEGI